MESEANQSLSQQQASMPVLSYATPRQYQPAGVWQDGDLVVAHARGAFPDRCVKCNAPAEQWRWNSTLYWHPSGYYLLIAFPGLLIYLIVALVVRKSQKVSVGLCSVHRSKRRWTILITWLLIVGGIASFIGGIALIDDRAFRDTALPPTMMLGGIALALVSAIVGIILSRVVSPKKIENDYAWLRGAGPAFRAGLPPARPPV